MAISHSQAPTPVIAAGVTSLGITYANAVTLGDLLTLQLRIAGTPSVSDNVNGTWSQGYNNSTGSNYGYYFLNSAAAGAGALTVTASSATSGAIRMAADAFTSGTSAYTYGTGTTGTTATATMTCTATASRAAGEMVWCGVGASTNSLTFTAGTSNGASMAIGGQLGDAANGSVASEYLLSSSSGAQNASITASVVMSGNGGQMVFAPPVDPFPVAYITWLRRAPFNMRSLLARFSLWSQSVIRSFSKKNCPIKKIQPYNTRLVGDLGLD